MHMAPRMVEMNSAPAVAGHADETVSRPRFRRFRAYNVGLAKTGTASIAGIFANYRSLHEFLFVETVQAVTDRDREAMSEEDFRKFIHWRDGLARLDVDSSSFNCYYVDVLAREFSDAKFIFVIRDCLSWLDSMLNMVLYIGQEMPDWMLEYVRRFLGPGYQRDLADRPTDLRQLLPGMIDAGFCYWSTINRFVLHALPADRSLILRTRELSRSLPTLAAFVGVPPETLRSEFSFVHRAARKYHLLQTVDHHVLSDPFEHYCTDLMQAFFPDVTLAGFLTRAL
jgi:hypothetical protein